MNGAPPGKEIRQQRRDVHLVERIPFTLETRARLDTKGCGTARVAVSQMVQRDDELNQALERRPPPAGEYPPLALEPLVRLEEETFVHETRGVLERGGEIRRRAHGVAAAARGGDSGEEAVPVRIGARHPRHPPAELVERGVARERGEYRRCDLVPSSAIAVDKERRHAANSWAISSACRSASARPSA